MPFSLAAEYRRAMPGITRHEAARISIFFSMLEQLRVETIDIAYILRLLMSWVAIPRLHFSIDDESARAASWGTRAIFAP